MLNSIENERKRKDCLLLLDILEDVSKEKPELWNGGMIGFGRYEYKYESGREGSWFLTGFAPRKNTTVLYLVGNIKEKASKAKEFGAYKAGSSWLYLKPLEQTDLTRLRSLIAESIANIKMKYGN